MEEYNILNSVKPGFLKPKYPFNLVDPKKIMLTQKKITILAKSLELKTNTMNSHKKVGGHNGRHITFYG